MPLIFITWMISGRPEKSRTQFGSSPEADLATLFSIADVQQTRPTNIASVCHEKRAGPAPETAGISRAREDLSRQLELKSKARSGPSINHVSRYLKIRASVDVL
jgi:hypothetical protein